MLSQSRSVEFLIVQSISYSKLYFTFWAWLDYKYMGHLGEIQFSFPFPSLPLDYFDVQDLKVLISIISFEIRLFRNSFGNEDKVVSLW